MADSHLKSLSTLQNGILSLLCRTHRCVSSKALQDDLQKLKKRRAALSEHPIVKQLKELFLEKSPIRLGTRREQFWGLGGLTEHIGGCGDLHGLS